MDLKLARNLVVGVGIHITLKTPTYPGACSVAHDGTLGLLFFKSDLNDWRWVSELAETFWYVLAYT